MMNEVLQQVLTDESARDGQVIKQVAAQAAQDYAPWFDEN